MRSNPSLCRPLICWNPNLPIFPIFPTPCRLPHAPFVSTASNFDKLRETDPEVYAATVAETRRQAEYVRLIPSENYTSAAVLQAMATVFANKYSEGYPGKRYYEGNEFVDAIEDLARNRAKQLFGADHANVQPYSGSPANLAACFALLKPGDKIMGMHLQSGGHLTHGYNLNFSGVYYQSVAYGYHVEQGVTGMNPATQMLDYDELLAIAKRERPNLIFAGGTAYPRQWDFARFRQIADEVDAYLVADIAHINGLIVGGVHPDPVPYADVVTSTSHKAIRGPRGGFILCKNRPMKDDPAQNLPDRIDKAIIPALQGGPHNNTIAALAVCFKEAASAGVPAVRASDRQERQGAGAGPARPGLHPGHRRHGQPPYSGRRDAVAQHSRQAVCPRSVRGRSGNQLQRGSQRPPQAVLAERPAHRHARRHDSRL